MSFFFNLENTSVWSIGPGRNWPEDQRGRIDRYTCHGSIFRRGKVADRRKGLGQVVMYNHLCRTKTESIKRSALGILKGSSQVGLFERIAGTIGLNPIKRLIFYFKIARLYINTWCVKTLNSRNEIQVFNWNVEDLPNFEKVKMKEYLWIDWKRSDVTCYTYVEICHLIWLQLIRGKV
jgi:hypothetical protein